MGRREAGRRGRPKAVVAPPKVDSDDDVSLEKKMAAAMSNGVGEEDEVQMRERRKEETPAGVGESLAQGPGHPSLSGPKEEADPDTRAGEENALIVSNMQAKPKRGRPKQGSEMKHRSGRLKAAVAKEEGISDKGGGDGSEEKHDEDGDDEKATKRLRGRPKTDHGGASDGTNGAATREPKPRGRPKKAKVKPENGAEEAVKRPRGRPRIYPIGAPRPSRNPNPNGERRPRGRPRKHPLPETLDIEG